MARQMRSITSAPGWNARVSDEASEDGVRAVVLAAWALMEEDGGETQVVGLVQRADGSIAPADDVPGFLGYAFTGLATRHA